MQASRNPILVHPEDMIASRVSTRPLDDVLGILSDPKMSGSLSRLVMFRAQKFARGIESYIVSLSQHAFSTAGHLGQ